MGWLKIVAGEKARPAFSIGDIEVILAAASYAGVKTEDPGRISTCDCKSK